MESIKLVDNWVLARLYAMNLHPKINVLLRRFTRLGDGYIWVFVVAYSFFAYSIERSLMAIVESSITAVLSLGLYKFVKKRVRRPRPYQSYDHVVAQIKPMDEFSFPSGHTMNNLAPGIAMALNFPEIAPFSIGIPLIWGVLRIYFGVHYLSDVLGGFLMALLCALVGNQLMQWLPL